MTQLLVSVRSASEAEAALAGGADLIDVKEPTRGALGRADDAAVAAVVRAIGGRRPVSAALGELRDFQPPHPPGLTFVKWGLSGLGGEARWHTQLEQAANSLGTTNPVAVAYADHVRANAPSPRDVAAFAVSRRWPAFLLDTFEKDGRTLLDWLDIEALLDLCQICHDAGVRIALAGSLQLEHIERLASLHADWVAVRSAACVNGHRDQVVCAKRVANLKHALCPPSPLYSGERGRR